MTSTVTGKAFDAFTDIYTEDILPRPINPDVEVLLF